MTVPGNASKRLRLKKWRDVGGTIMCKPPNGRRAPTRFNTEYFSCKGLFDPCVAIVTVRRSANRSTVIYTHIAPREVLRLTPIEQDWQHQLRNLREIIQGAHYDLHITFNRRTIDHAVEPNNLVPEALVEFALATPANLQSSQIPNYKPSQFVEIRT